MIPENRWFRGPILGAMVGLPVLGVGGRLAMHAFSTLGPGQKVVSVEGTITVLLAGMGSGLAGGAIYALLDQLIRRRSLRAVTFAVVLAFLGYRGLHPVDLTRIALFGPVMLFYGAIVEWAFNRNAGRGAIGASQSAHDVKS